MTAKELRELDAWIAEHVMGWTWWRFRIKKSDTVSDAGKGYTRWQQLVPPTDSWYRQPRWGGVPQPQGKGRYLEDETDLSMFKPTTDPAAAMEVLKKCGPKVDGVIQIGEIGGKWLVYSHETDDDSGLECETLELAICQFAKKLFTK